MKQQEKGLNFSRATLINFMGAFTEITTGQDKTPLTRSKLNQVFTEGQDLMIFKFEPVIEGLVTPVAVIYDPESDLPENEDINEILDLIGPSNRPHIKGNVIFLPQRLLPISL